MSKQELKIKVESGDQSASHRLSALIPLTNKENPKPEDIAELRHVFKEFPEFALDVGNIQKIIFGNILESFVGGSALRREAAEIFVKKMKDELGYSYSTFLEQMLIDEIVMRWLRLSVMENDHKNATYESHTFTKGLYYDKRLDIAQKRYLRAV